MNVLQWLAQERPSINVNTGDPFWQDPAFIGRALASLLIAVFVGWVLKLLWNNKAVVVVGSIVVGVLLTVWWTGGVGR